MKRTIFGFGCVSILALMTAGGCLKADDNPGELIGGSSGGSKSDEPGDGPSNDDESDGGSTPGTSTSGGSPGATTFGTTTAATGSTTAATGGAGDGPAVCMGDRPLGTYADCKETGVVDNTVCNSGDATCLVNSTTNSSWAVCMFEGCESDCDCPASPGGTAEPTCLDLTSDGDNDCVLACGGGKTCPAGMRCKTTGTPYCVWDEFSPAYGDCINGGDCAEGLTCVYDAGSVELATRGVCVEAGCQNAEDCPTYGAGTVLEVDIDCDNVVEQGPNVCYIGCDGGTPCPDGMECVEGVHDICMWRKG